MLKWDDPEENPWKSLSYIFFVVQFMFMTLDLFMDTSVEPGWHYAITTIEFLVSMLLSFYQLIRLGNLRPSCQQSYTTKPLFLLLVSFFMQFSFILIAGYSYSTNVEWAEWTMFCVNLAWGFVNPMTYESVASAMEKCEQEQAQDTSVASTEKKKHLGWTGALRSIFLHHFSRTPLLCALATLFAIGQALLGTYQGAVISELTNAVTEDNAGKDVVERLAINLAIVWAFASLCRFIFDVLSARMFAKLEIWLRSTVFDKAVQDGNDGDHSLLTAADYQARYASDITGVVGLYNTLLRGVVVNVLLIITNFVFLVIVNWKIAAITLGFLAMGVTSGPTDLAGTAAQNVQDDVTNGLSILQDFEEDPKKKVDQHNSEVMVPMQADVFKKSFYSNMVDTFNGFFSSFLTDIVVISMSWDVFNGNMDSSQFLAIFFVFKQLQKPATKISGVIKKAVTKTANLERINAVVLDEPSDVEETSDEDAG